MCSFVSCHCKQEIDPLRFCDGTSSKEAHSGCCLRSGTCRDSESGSAGEVRAVASETGPEVEGGWLLFGGGSAPVERPLGLSWELGEHEHLFLGSLPVSPFSEGWAEAVVRWIRGVALQLLPQHLVWVDSPCSQECPGCPCSLPCVSAKVCSPAFCQ